MSHPTQALSAFWTVVPVKIAVVNQRQLGLHEDKGKDLLQVVSRIYLLSTCTWKTLDYAINNMRSSQWRIQTMRLGGGSQIGERQKCLHLLKYQRLSETKEVIFCRSKSGYFCWSNYAIFQGITTVWKRFISLIQKTFETGSKQWASFFTTYTDLVYLQNVFKRYKRQNTGHIPGKKSAGNKLVYTVFLLVEQCDFSGTNHSLKVLYNINS